jgi:N4-gp56 family major capsid protein
MTIATFGSISQRTALYAEAKMLEHARPVNILSMFGQVKPVPKNKSDTVKFRRPVPFAVSTIPLQEGVTPTSHGITFEDVQVQIKQYGDIAALTDVIQDIAEDPVLDIMSELSGENAGAVLEQITWGILKAGTSVYYANGANRAAVNTTISLNKQRAVTRYLRAQKAKKMRKVLSPSVQIGTSAIEEAYIAVGHTNLESDIRNLAGFIPTAKYGQRTLICEQEIGSVEDVRYILSPDLSPIPDAGGTPGSTVLSTTGSAADIYPVLFFGMDAYGLTPLRGRGSITPTVINPNTIDKSDPLGQRGFVGWKSWFAAVRLNETWMSRLEVGAGVL